ncbi:MAG: hypothetical protein ING19_05585, partial [Azospirillum sp.]|nr:hypothetical protein [Azospirillum sp.]
MNEDSILTAAKAEIARARENGAELRLRDVAAKLGISISALYAVISACPDVHADYLAAKRNAKLVLARRIADAFLALAKEADAKGKTRRGSLFALEKEFDMTRENMRLLLRENLPEFYETHVRKNRSKSPKPPRA